jgi:hypothetical protein
MVRRSKITLVTYKRLSYIRPRRSFREAQLGRSSPHFWELRNMKNTIATLFAISMLVSGAACAAESQVVIAGTDPATVHAKLLAAADKLCATARSHDPLDDFGSQDECIENTLDYVKLRHRAYQPQYTQRQTNNPATP